MAPCPQLDYNRTGVKLFSQFSNVVTFFSPPSCRHRLAHWPSISDSKNTHRPFLAFNVVPLCHKAAARFLGMSTKTLGTLRKHAEENVNPPVDGRTGFKMPVMSEAKNTADAMWTWIHQFMAEPLAESTVKPGALVLPALKSLVDGSSLVFSTSCVEQRWLPPNTTFSELLETSWAFGNFSGTKPSYSTFTRVFHDHDRPWARSLKFRCDCQHAKCTECEKLKEYKRLAYSAADAERVSAAYHAHLASMLQDRQRDAQLNLVAAQFMKEGAGDRAIISMCIDGMDTAKFRTPRNISWNKDIAGCYRPEVKLSCIIIEGHSENYFLIADSSAKDANMSLTLLSHALAECLDHLKEKGFPMADAELRIHSDNSPAEAKNQVNFKWAAMLLAQGYFRRVTWTQFLVGHSHSKIDQRFCEIRAALCSWPALQVL